jgi:hypothetical protein
MKVEADEELRQLLTDLVVGIFGVSPYYVFFPYLFSSITPKSIKAYILIDI